MKIKFSQFLVLLLLSVVSFDLTSAIDIGGPVASTTPTLYPPAPTLYPPTQGPVVTKAPYVPPPTNTIPTDLTVMKILANQLNSVLPSWDPALDPCLTLKWAGVTCNSAGYITGIDLSGRYLGVPLDTFASLSQLPYLQEINLSGTSVSGSIPAEWSKLSYLKNMDVSDNGDLGGIWPASINYVAMPNLKDFNATFTDVQYPWAYYCPPLPAATGYFYKTPCVGKGASHSASKSLISYPVISPCATSNIPDNYFVSSLCQPGTFYAAGSDRIITQCSTPKANQFVSQTCITGANFYIGADTVIAQCSQPVVTEGSYVSKCASGSYNILGFDAVAKPCSQPIPGQQYTAKPCFAGNLGYNLAGTDTVILPCNSSPVPSSHYVSTLCSSGTYYQVGANRVTKPCSVPKDGQFVEYPCTSGSSDSIGSDTVLQQCTVPVSGYYVSNICIQGSVTSAGTDTMFQPCGDFDTKFTSPCIAGSYKMLGTAASASQSKSVASTSSVNVGGIVVGVIFVLLIVAMVVVYRGTTAESRKAALNNVVTYVKNLRERRQNAPQKTAEPEVEQAVEHETTFEVHVEEHHEVVHAANNEQESQANPIENVQNLEVIPLEETPPTEVVPTQTRMPRRHRNHSRANSGMTTVV